MELKEGEAGVCLLGSSVLVLPRALGCSPARLPRPQRELLSQGGFWQLPPAVPSATAGAERMGQTRIQPPQHGQGSSLAGSLAKGAKPCFGSGSLAGGLQGEPERGQLSLGWLEGR